MEIKLILLDLDLTLLRSDRTISSFTLAVLRKCQEAGILVGFSTSRGNKNVSEYVELVHPDVVICNAGGCVYYKNNLLHAESFSNEESRCLISSIYSVFGEDVEITVDVLNDIYWNKKQDKSESYSPDAIFDDLKDFKKCAMKMCVQTTDVEKIKKACSVSDNVSFIPFSDIPWYKLSPKNVSKENAVLWLGKELKIDVKEMIAFGDDFADMGMLKLCGTGVAMGNAIESVKEISDFVTESCDEDGVAKFLCRFLKDRVGDINNY